MNLIVPIPERPAMNLYCLLFGHRRRYDYDFKVHYCARRGCSYLEGD